MSAARPASPTGHDVAVVYSELAGSLGAMSREEICSRTGLPDRTVREAIADLVTFGEPIVSDRGSGGYLLTRDSEKLKSEIGRLRSAASRMLERALALEGHLR